MQPISDMLNRLIDIIGREAALFESFLELLDQQKRTLVSNHLEGLNEVTDKQREKLVESRLLSRERDELIRQIKAANSLEGDVTVTRLLEFADRDQAERLTQLREIILDMNDRIARARNTNAMLLNQSREFIARTMTALSKIKNPDHTYAADGAAAGKGSNVAVDRRV
ncbi:MAG TPA: flagellar protein FlgN [Acidobacteriota bacterium]|nr:flagellar protein FlgN [Acidobacteriota bacterium]